MPQEINHNPRVLGERLVMARKAAGKTQEDAASLLGVSRPTYIAIEKGTRPTQPDELVRLAAFFQRSVHELVRPGAPIALEPHLRGVIDPDHSDATELFEAVEYLQRFAEDYKELERLLDAPLHANYPPEVRLPTRGDLRQFAEDVASNERNRLQLGDQPIPDLRKVLESEVGVRVFYGKLPAAIAGMYAYVPELGYCTLINIAHPPERRRASLGHEYAHFLIDRHKPGVDYLSQGGRKPANERFAEAFSLAFLVPQIGLRRQFNDILHHTGDFRVADLVRLSIFYYVSVQAMALRLEHLSLIGKGWWDYLKEAGFRPNSAKEELRVEQDATESFKPYPERYEFLAVHAFERELISEGQLARFLRCDRVDARRIVEECLTRIETENGVARPIQLPFEKSLLTDAR